MRFMVIVKGNAQSESGVLPEPAMLEAMGKFNEEMVRAGVLLDGNGLHPTSKGCKIRFNGATRTVVDGPFAEAKEIVAGYWIIEVKSKEEAIEWIKRSPNPFPEGESEVEIRQVYAPEDFAPVDPTGEVRAKEEAMRKQIGARKG
jgi:hypothetical protein